MGKVYFAGPICDEDWRRDIFGCNPLDSLDKILVADGYTYVGPKRSKESTYVEKHDDLVIFNDGTVDIKTELFKRCIEDISRANAVFAWIDSEDRYGTLAEIMYAFSKGLYIYVVISPSISTNELWFPLEAASVVVKTDNIKSAWKDFTENNPFKERVKITEGQGYLLSKELAKYQLELMPGSMNKHQAKKLIAALVNPSSGFDKDKTLLQYIEDKKVRHKTSNDVKVVMKKQVELRSRRNQSLEDIELEERFRERIRQENVERAERSRVRREKEEAALRYNLDDKGLQKLVCEALGERITMQPLQKAIRKLKICGNQKYYKVKTRSYTDEAVAPLVAYFKEKKRGK
ncbi:hypothetical protein [Lysinibacillus fusiformis]|uniref:hypothetical protein n=1 Tax=Lysinibacillus fusiformis TaxID=28031 RepID=UPI003018919B